MKDYKYNRREHKNEVLGLLEEITKLQQVLVKSYARSGHPAFKERIESLQETKKIIKKNNHAVLC